MARNWLKCIVPTRLYDSIHARVNQVASSLFMARLRLSRLYVFKYWKAGLLTDDEFLLQLSRINLGSDYTVGISSHDAYHNVVAFKFSCLVNEIAWGDQSRMEMDDIFDKISIFISEITLHLLAEEKEMIEHNYPKMTSHKLEHDSFLADIIVLADGINQNEYGVEGLLFFIGSWLSGHILISDRYYGEFLDN
ncbi:MAG: hemerythrin family protein [Rhodospirillaceae bacterium]